MTLRDYIWNVAQWLSQGLNTVAFAGNPNMTFSARCYVNRDEKVWSTAHKLVNILFFFQPEHCKQAYETDVKFANMVVEELGINGEHDGPL